MTGAGILSSLATSDDDPSNNKTTLSSLHSNEEETRGVGGNVENQGQGREGTSFICDNDNDALATSHPSHDDGACSSSMQEGNGRESSNLEEARTEGSQNNSNGYGLSAKQMTTKSGQHQGNNAVSDIRQHIEDGKDIRNSQQLNSVCVASEGFITKHNKDSLGDTVNRNAHSNETQCHSNQDICKKSDQSTIQCDHEYATNVKLQATESSQIEEAGHGNKMIDSSSQNGSHSNKGIYYAYYK